MSFEIYRTTAEHVIGATDAALQLPEGVNQDIISSFLDIPSDSASNAILMAEQLFLLSKNQAGLFTTSSPCAMYLCTSIKENKAAILRFVLEQYEPFKTFKFRLEISTGVVAEAATKTRASHYISAHRDVLAATFIDLGTYSNSLTHQGAGLYLGSSFEEKEYLKILDKVIQERESTEAHIRRRIGNVASEWIDNQNVLQNLITAYQKASNAREDSRAPIVHAANAFESFLAQMANHFNVNLQGATGINAIIDKLASDHKITKKHKFIAKYLGHVRNATDHGIDQDIGTQWKISENSAIEYVHITQTLIVAIVSYINGTYVI